MQLSPARNLAPRPQILKVKVNDGSLSNVGVEPGSMVKFSSHFKRVENSKVYLLYNKAEGEPYVSQVFIIGDHVILPATQQCGGETLNIGDIEFLGEMMPHLRLVK